MKSLVFRYYKPSNNILELLLHPILLPAKFIHNINQSFINSVWDELMLGKKTYTNLSILFGIFLFFIGSLYFYKYEQFLEIVVLLFTIIIFTDKFIIWLLPFLFGKKVKVVLKEKENGIIEWKSSSSKHRRYFKVDQIEHLYIIKNTSKRGFFLEEYYDTWELIIRFKQSNIQTMVLFESEYMKQVQSKAIKLSKVFGMSWNQQDETNGSRDANNYQTNPFVKYSPNFSRELKVISKKKKTVITPCVTIRGCFYIIAKAFKETGFVLLLVLVSSFLKNIGEIFAAFYGPTFGVEAPEGMYHWSQFLFYFIDSFRLDFDPVDIFELGVALLMIFMYIADHFKARYITIKNNYCYIRNGLSKTKLDLDKLKMRVIDSDKNQLLLHDDKKVTVLDHFGNAEDCRRLLRFIPTLKQTAQ